MKRNTNKEKGIKYYGIAFRYEIVKISGKNLRKWPKRTIYKSSICGKIVNVIGKIRVMKFENEKINMIIVFHRKNKIAYKSYVSSFSKKKVPL